MTKTSIAFFAIAALIFGAMLTARFLTREPYSMEAGENGTCPEGYRYGDMVTEHGWRKKCIRTT